MSSKIFIGRVDSKQMQGGNGPWEKITIAFGPKDFEALQMHKNEKGWVNLLFKESAQGKKYIELDTYVPTRPSGFETPQQQPSVPIPPAPDDDLPF